MCETSELRQPDASKLEPEALHLWEEREEFGSRRLTETRRDVATSHTFVINESIWYQSGRLPDFTCTAEL
ncbi:hypothetical protein AOLI_G00291210 [Acnodon oligacanthus]